MKVSGFCALFLVIVAALSFFNFLSTTSPSWIPDLIGTKCDDKTTPIATSRKLKENVGMSSDETGDISDHVTLEDYSPIDPSPGAAKNVKAGPIEHGTPLMPFIPKPPPPSPFNSAPGDYN
ncbi:uncharacterized protein [Cicer arietinum]|uniref:Uncharacterized protein LOC101489422 n=1 Tax=Cicer arietinum TaxID=3827 RepID=A0A1S2Y417_CICAR|nr:uncharacterized protein LOC101489422 [Cicer arietinum]